MRALLDVNALIAMLDAEHTHHERARSWWRVSKEAGWASCPVTEKGYVRIVSQPRYARPLTTALAVRTLKRQFDLPGHEFWRDNLSICDPTVFDASYLAGPKQITDVYLLALAVRNGGRLVTFDRSVPLKAVRGAAAVNLVVI